MSLVNRVVELSESGLPTKKIRATLQLEDFSDKDISAAIKEAGITSRRASFANEFYDWLAEAPRDSEEVKKYILNEKNSENVRKHLSHYAGIADMARKIHEQK